MPNNMAYHGKLILALTLITLMIAPVALPAAQATMPSGGTLTADISPNTTSVTFETSFPSNASFNGYLIVQREGACIYTLDSNIIGFVPSLGNVTGSATLDFTTRLSYDNVSMIAAEASMLAFKATFANASGGPGNITVSITREGSSNTSLMPFERTSSTTTKIKLYIDTANVTIDLSGTISSDTSADNTSMNSTGSFSFKIHIEMKDQQSPYLPPVIDVDVTGTYETITIGNETTVKFNVKIYFPDPMYGPFLAQMTYAMLNNMINMMGLQDNVTVSMQGTQTVLVSGELTVNATSIGGMLGGQIPGVGRQIPLSFTGFRGMMANATPLYIPETLANAIEAEVSLHAELAVDRGNVSFTATGNASATGVDCRSLVGLELFRLDLWYDEANSMQHVKVQLEVATEEPFTPFLALKAMLLGMFDGMGMGMGIGPRHPANYTIILNAGDDVSFLLDDTEYKTVVFVSSNITKLRDLKMVYQSIVVGEMGDVVHLVAVGVESATVIVTPTSKGIDVEGPKRIEINVPYGGGKLVRNLEINIVNDVAGNVSIVIHKDSKLSSTVLVETLSPSEALAYIPSDLKARVVGPAVDITGVKGGATLRIPVDVSDNVVVIVIHDDGTYEIIRDITVGPGYIEVTVPSMSKIIPAILEEETTTTTETATETTTTTTTTTQPPTTTTTTATSPTTTSPTTTTPTTTTPISPGTTPTTQPSPTQTATETTTTPQTTTEATTPTTTAEEGLSTTQIIAAIIVLIVAAAAALILLRR